MAKRELSSTLRSLKFMQRGSQKEEKPKKEEDVKPDAIFFTPPTLTKKCVVIMEGDPHPGAIKGRMSFQSFNPSIDKLNEEAANPPPEASASCSVNQSGRTPERDNGSLLDGSDVVDRDGIEDDADGDLKRKQSEVISEPLYPHKSPKNSQGNQSGSHKQSKPEKLDWNVLRPPKHQNKKK